MSGLEVAGIVLGAFPLAVAALTESGKAVKRIWPWSNIGLEHKKCRDEIDFHRLVLTGHLRQLLSGLVPDETEVEGLLKNPGGLLWKEASLDERLRERLGETYGLYFSYITGMQQVMETLTEELMVNSTITRGRLTTPKVSRTGSDNTLNSIKEKGRLFLYRAKFSHGESARRDLIRQLEEYNHKLEKLLSSRNTSLVFPQRRTPLKQAPILDSAICSFWKEASRLFRALNSNWDCTCKENHHAKLLLQHRNEAKSEFTVMFETMITSTWDIYKTRILEESLQPMELVVKSNDLDKISTIHQPLHRHMRPTKSALRSESYSGRGKQLVALSEPHENQDQKTCNPAKSTLSSPERVRPLRTLCTPCKQDQTSCWGYVNQENCSYYIYTVSRQSVQNLTYVTLDQILRGQVFPRPSRRRRYALSLILASSFLQLMDTPWLPMLWNRTNIVFYGDSKRLDILDEPHLSRNFFTGPNNELDESPKDGPKLSGSFHELGIILLELCFGETLEEQPHRQKFRAGENDSERKGFDLAAAITWQQEIIDEAGQDYSAAVEWCLGKIKPKDWRREMLENVVLPLQRSHDYLNWSMSNT